MAKDTKILKPLMKLPSNERAAALAHWIYVQTTQRGENKWNLRVAAPWDKLDSEPKNFNILTVDTWLDHPELLDAWVAALRAYKNERAERKEKPRGRGGSGARQTQAASRSAKRSRAR